MTSVKKVSSVVETAAVVLDSEISAVVVDSPSLPVTVTVVTRRLGQVSHEDEGRRQRHVRMVAGGSVV
jgi:hypothetical protein